MLNNTKALKIGIDAANLRRGGGRTHLIEILNAVKVDELGIGKIIVWGSRETLGLLEDKPWLEKIAPNALEGGLVKRLLWQKFSLSKLARDVGCDVLFVPGGSYSGDFRPVVSMSRNMLPFEWNELLRYGVSALTLKLVFLRSVQKATFKRSDGVIFLTQYAQNVVENVVSELRFKKIIPHGLNIRFSREPKLQKDIENYDRGSPFRLLYVSIIDMYKHQWNLVEAVARLREKTGWPIVLDLVGPFYPPALKILEKTIDNVDRNRSWVNYYGAMPFSQLHKVYVKADLGVFASSCENMPNILLETQAAGLPVACSDKGPMPEILGDAGEYFDPENPKSIADALECLIASKQLRASMAEKSYEKSIEYTWERCAKETFMFIADLHEEYKASS